MNGIEKLREYADATEWGGMCSVLHEHHGDFACDCSGRECSECKAAYLHAIADEVQENMRDADARMMPEGMAWLLEVWPKWSNGEYCKFGDWWTADKYGDYEPKQLRRLVFYTPEQLREWEQDEGDNFGYEWDFMRPSDTTYRPDKAEPPAPKVLDADGVEIKQGDTVYRVGMSTFDPEYNTLTVTDIRTKPGLTPIETKNSHDGYLYGKPEDFTHRAPVLAADGRPLREGEHVYHVETGTELVVKWLPKPGEYQAVVVFALPTSPASHLTSFDPDQLTHERPDSWERLEEDARSCTCVMEAIDLVRRCRALAERERGE